MATKSSGVSLAGGQVAAADRQHLLREVREKIAGMGEGAFQLDEFLDDVVSDDGSRHLRLLLISGRKPMDCSVWRKAWRPISESGPRTREAAWWLQPVSDIDWSSRKSRNVSS